MLQRISDRTCIGYLLFQLEREHRAFPVGALNVQLAVHKRKKPCNDSHSKTCALDVPVPFRFKACERLKELIKVLLADTDARVADADAQHRFVTCHSAASDVQRNASLFGVLYRICEQVAYDLRNTDIVTDKHAWQVRVGIHSEYQSLGPCTLGNGVHKIVYQHCGIVSDRQYLHFAVLYL